MTNEQFYQKYNNGRSRAAFNRDWAAFQSGLTNARQSTSNPNATKQFLARVDGLKPSTVGRERN